MPAAASTRPAMRWNQLRGRRASTRSPSSISSAGGPDRPRGATPSATARSSSAVDAEAQRAVERPGRAARCRPPAPAGRAWRRSTASGSPATIDDVLDDRPRRVVHGDAERRVRVGALGRRDVDDVVARRSRRGRAGGRRRRARSAMTPGDSAAAIARPSNVIGAPPAVSTSRHGWSSVPSPSIRRSTRRVIPSARAWLAVATPCCAAISSNSSFTPSLGARPPGKGNPSTVVWHRPDPAVTKRQNALLADRRGRCRGRRSRGGWCRRRPRSRRRADPAARAEAGDELGARQSRATA